MDLHILHDIPSYILSSPFLTAMADETTDISNSEQATIYIHWVTDPRGFIGYSTVDSIQAATLVSDLRDRFLRLKISLERLRGQYYVGSSAISEKSGGVAKELVI